jgi:hypothetical protein
MATRTISSPGVQIFESDLSLVAPANVGTTVFVTGYTNQGPTDEVIKITSKSDLDLVYGTPTNSAERYFYYTVRELLNSPSNIYASRLPYGSDTGAGFSSKFSALAYPAVATKGLSGYTSTLATNTSAANLSAAKLTFVTSNGSTKTVGFSSTSVAPALSTLDVYATYTGTNPAGTALVDSLSTAIATIDTGKTFSKSGTALTYTLSASVNRFDFDFTQAPTGTTVDARNSNDSFDINEGTYLLGAPTHMELTEDQYNSIIDGSGFEWSSTQNTTFNTVASLSSAAVIVVNKAQTGITDQFEGYYVALGDNMNINPATDFNSIVGVKTLNSAVSSTKTFIDIPISTLQFSLTSTLNGPANSISELMENLTGYDISTDNDDDLLNVGVFKIRKSIYATESFALDYVLEDRLVGSIDYYRTITSENGGPVVNNYIGTVDQGSRNVEILVNDFISNRLKNSSVGIDGVPKKKIRVLTSSLVSNNGLNASSGFLTTTIQSLSSSLGFADNLYGLGAYVGVEQDDKVLGDIPAKIERVLDAVRNDDIYDIDIVVEGGLGTIYAAASGAGKNYYDETLLNTALATQLSGIRTSNAIAGGGLTLRNNYNTIFNIFETFCSPPYIGGGRGDCVFIADPIRHILVTGTNNKVASNKNTVFQRDIYWALRHQFENANTSYAIAYANWGKVYDSYTGQQVWVPFSGFAAAAMARTDAARYPWIAPAGFTNGLVPTSIDLAVSPNQKQRDELYKVNLNAVAFFPSQGQVIYGQKTLSRKPSAFDRINVRRLFLALERPTKKVSQFFVFEPNSTFTRARLINTLTPIFDKARNTEGIEDYLIVCDERNNTPQVIDNNELVVDIYIKPIRASEFILVNFIATRTDANFQEIIGG